MVPTPNSAVDSNVTTHSGELNISFRSDRSRVGGVFQAIYIIWYRDLLRYWRDRVRIIASFAQPLIFLFIFGEGLGASLGGAAATGAFGGHGSSSVSYIQFIYPGVVGMAILFTAIFSAMSIVWDREFGFLREILVAPVDRAAVAFGKALGGATQAVIQGIIMLALSFVVGVHLTIPIILELLVVFFVLAFALTSMGVAVAARMKSMQGFQVVMNFFVMPLFFLSGALFPIATGLPGWMQVLTRFDPVAYGIAPVRALVLGATKLPSAVITRVSSVSIGSYIVPMWGDVIILAAFGAVMVILAMYEFSRRD